jgi:hypothetical protein
VVHLGLPPDARLLDVGGYPGTLADLLSDREILTLDRPHCAREDYVCGTAIAIPFNDESFDLIISSDTLEHLSPSDREQFLEELVRVSARYIILGAPFQSKPVEFCEEKISALYERCYAKPHPWLSEHTAHSLPLLDAVCTFFQERKCKYVAIPNGNLYLWFMMESLQLLLAGFPNATPLVANFQPHFNRLWAISTPATPAYRHLLVVAKSGQAFPAQISSMVPPETDEPQTAIMEKLQALHELFENLYSSIEEVFADPDKKGLILTGQYIDQLEKIVAHQEKEVLRQTKELGECRTRLRMLERSPITRLLRKLRIF